MSAERLRRIECADQAELRQLARDTALLAMYVSTILKEINVMRGGTNGKRWISAGPWMPMSEHADCIEERWRDEMLDNRP